MCRNGETGLEGRVCNGLSDPIELLVPLTLVLPGAVESFRFLLDSAEQGLAAGGRGV